MHVKEQVKEFVHDVKRKFSKKHRRDSTCSTCADRHDHDGASSYSSVDTIGTIGDSSSSSAVSSRPGTPERSRFGSFLHPRTSLGKHNHGVLHRARRQDGKRYRLFSAPTVPSPRIDASISSHRQAATEPSFTPKGSMWKARTVQDVPSTTSVSSSVVRHYPTVIDISASAVGQSTRFFRDSSCQTPPHFDSQSENSGTLVNTDPQSINSVSNSDWHFDCAVLGSDERSLSTPSLDKMPPVLPPKSDQVVLHEEITLTHSPRPANLDNPTIAISPVPVVSQAYRTVSPAKPESAPASPAPVYIPRLTAPSMFLPIPNTLTSAVCHGLTSVFEFHPFTDPRFEAMTADQLVPPHNPPFHCTDPLSALLTKYVPAEQRPSRDVAGEYASRDIHEMAMSNSWRALAKMARDRIVASDPEDLARILDLWSLRLSSLARLRLTNQASAECTNLFAVLNAVIPASVPGSFPGSGMSPSVPVPSSPAPAPSVPLSPSGLGGLAQLPGTPSHKPSALPAGTSPTTAKAPRQHATPELVHPFELTVFHARVHYWSGDPLGYVDALSRILGQCKQRAREEARVVAQRRELGRVRPRDVEEASQSEATGESEDVDEEDDEGADAEVQDEAEEQDALKASQSNDEDDDDKEDVKESTNAEVQDVLQPSQSNDEEDSTGTDIQNDKAEEQDDILVAAEANLSMWLERVARICLILASQMVEMNDYQAAINLLTPLCTQRTAPALQPTPSPELHAALARIYLLAGSLAKAEEHFSIAASAAANTDALVMNAALMAAASGDWPRAEEALTDLVAKQSGNFTAMNNLAVTLLCQGRIKKGIDLLEAALKTSPSAVVVAEPFLFNLSTMYELRSTAAIDKKRELLIEVAKWSGDGLKTSCLKMPSS